MNRTSIANRKYILCIAAFLAIAVPLVILVPLIIRSTSTTSTYYIDYTGALKDGELWIGSGEVTTYNKGFPLKQSIESQIKILNLQTGAWRTFDAKMPKDEMIEPFCQDGQIFVSSGNRIYRISDSSLVSVAPIPPGSLCRPFFYYDLWTIIIATNDGPRLSQYRDDEWVPGRKILLPDADSRWRNDPVRGAILEPAASAQSGATSGSDTSISVLCHDGQIHLLVNILGSLTAYRQGFDFVNDDDNPASATRSVNPPLTGWEPIRDAHEGFIRMCGIAKDGLYFRTDPPGMKREFFRRTVQGQWEKAFSFETDIPFLSYCEFLSDPAQDGGYLIDVRSWWETGKVYRVSGNRIQPSHLTLSGTVPQRLAWWRNLVLVVLTAWIAHLAILVGGLLLSRYQAPIPTYSFGNQTVQLASFPQRIGALIIDVILVVLVFGFASFLRGMFLGVEWNRISDQAWCEQLAQVEFNLSPVVNPREVLFHLEILYLWLTPTRLPQSFQPTEIHTVLICMVSLGVVVVLLMKIFFEGQHGITPGKWLFGIRTLRTTLRPCGFGRSLIRHLLLQVDVPFSWPPFLAVLTPFPAVLSLGLSPNQQRLGDFVADTIVVKDGVRRKPELESRK